MSTYIYNYLRLSIGEEIVKTYIKNLFNYFKNEIHYKNIVSTKTEALELIDNRNYKRVFFSIHKKIFEIQKNNPKTLSKILKKIHNLSTPISIEYTEDEIILKSEYKKLRFFDDYFYNQFLKGEVNWKFEISNSKDMVLDFDKEKKKVYKLFNIKKIIEIIYN